MSVYAKLMKARIKLQATEIKKTGLNKFAGYTYLQMQDFLPTVNEIFAELGLCGVVSFGREDASLTIIDIENPTDRVVVWSPMSSAALKGAHEVQNLGAVQSYLRRYLWVTAMEIVEHDALDATLGAAEPEKPKPVAKKTAPPPVNQPTDKPWAISISSEGDWVGNVTLGVTKALEMAETKEDVLQIFKVNRSVFDELAAKDKAVYDDLVAMFGEAKKKFAE